MLKDIANIYKLSPNKLDELLQNVWADTAPEIAEFAENLGQLIEKSGTPYVLGLDGGYGTGKTHFATRFSKFLDDRIKTVYFSVWEHDYLSDPFAAFAEQIIWLARQIGANKDLIKKIATSLTKSTKLKAGINLGIFHCEAEVNGDKLINELFPEKTRQETFQEMKTVLAEFILGLPEQKLVLIVDELDRCRPDYAVKVLETVKHFFDIDGLFVIMPVNRERLKIYIDGFYGINDEKARTINGKEDYLQKFINSTMNIPSLNYVKICDDKITAPDFEVNLTNEDGLFNSVSELKKWLVHYAKKACLSYRETCEVINRAKTFCNYYNEDIRCHLLANKLCAQVYLENKKRTSNSSMEELTFESNYIYNNKYNRYQQIPKDKILTSNSFCTLFNSTRFRANSYQLSNIRTSIDTLLRDSSKFSSYETLHPSIDKLISLATDLKSENFNYHEDKQQADNFYASILEKNQELLQFQKITGSDDNDEQRLADYEDKIKNPANLFEQI